MQNTESLGTQHSNSSLDTFLEACTAEEREYLEITLNNTELSNLRNQDGGLGIEQVQGLNFILSNHRSSLKLLEENEVSGETKQVVKSIKEVVQKA